MNCGRRLETPKELRLAYPPPSRKRTEQRSENENKKENTQRNTKQTPGLISAASKFLWLLHQTPVVIYDDRACRYLNSLAGTLSDKEGERKNYLILQEVLTDMRLTERAAIGRQFHNVAESMRGKTSGLRAGTLLRVRQPATRWRYP